MNKQRLWTTVLLVVLAGCGSANLQAQPTSPSGTAPATSTRPVRIESDDALTRNTETRNTDLEAVSSDISGDTSDPEASNTAQTAAPDLMTSPTATSAQSVALTIQQDYEATTPLPSTGRVTIRDDIRNLDPDRLIAECPTDTAPYAFAESTHYQVQICSQEFDPWLPKYYIGHAKDGSGDLRITSDNPDEARQLIFKHEGYTYAIYRDGRNPDRTNAYLQVFTPGNDNHAEALLYLYEAGRLPQ